MSFVKPNKFDHAPGMIRALDKSGRTVGRFLQSDGEFGRSGSGSRLAAGHGNGQ
jgi:hypothetical protein